MNEQEILEATRKLTLADVAEFLTAHGAKIECPVCGWNEWTMVEPVTAGVSMIPLQREEKYQLPPPSVPAVAIICNKCAFIRLHAAMPIAKWKNDEGKQ